MNGSGHLSAIAARMASIPSFGLCVALHHPRESARGCLFGRKAGVGGFVHVSRDLGAFWFQKEKLFAPEIVRIGVYVSIPKEYPYRRIAAFSVK